MGDIQLVRAYRMDSGYSMAPFQHDQNELLWQLQPGHPYQFLWSSGGVFIELMIHQIDECFWIKDSWPVSAHGVGGRLPPEHRLQPEPGQLLDRVHLRGRHQDACDRPLHPQLLSTISSPISTAPEVRCAVLGQHSRIELANLQGPADRLG